MRCRPLLLVLAVALIAVACSPDDEIVFDNRTIATSEPTSTTVASADATSTTSTTVPPTTTTVAPTTTAPPVTIPALEHELFTGELPAPVLLHVTPSTVQVLATDGTVSFERTEPDIFIAQPNWSPDGTRFAWARADAAGQGSIMLGILADGSVTEYPTPYIPFYLQWRPDGNVLGLLGSVPGNGQPVTGLTTLDLDSGVVEPHYSASTFYFQWAPDGASIVTHLDVTQAQLYEMDSKIASLLDSTLGPFQAAQWAPDGSGVYYVRPATDSVAAGMLAAAQIFDTGELVFHDVASDEATVIYTGIGIQEFTLSPDGARVAVHAAASAEGGVMSVVDVTTGEETTIESPVIEFMHWSPDSSRVLLMGWDFETRAVTYRVWSDEGVTEYATALASQQFLGRYLQFWGQYDRSHVLWAPDSSGFVFSVLEGSEESIFYQDLESALPALLGPGAVATFPPVGP